MTDGLGDVIGAGGNHHRRQIGLYKIELDEFGVDNIETIYGNLQGLKSSQLKQLQRLYHQRLPGDRITTPEFAQRLGAISTEINQPACAYINRRGQVIRVGVGTPRQTQIPPWNCPATVPSDERGIRCIVTKLKPEPPGESSLTAMAVQRLDVLAVLNVTGGDLKDGVVEPRGM